jgi:hypothetical protein
MLAKCERPAPPQVTERYREILGAGDAPDAAPLVQNPRSLASLVSERREEEAARIRRMEEEDRRLIAKVAEESGAASDSDAAGAMLAD